MSTKNYFPIRIKLVETNEILVIHEPEHLPSGIPFVVLNTVERCSNCGKPRPDYPVKSFGAAIRAQGEGCCWLYPEVCAVTPDDKRVFLDGKPISTADIDSHFWVRSVDENGNVCKTLCEAKNGNLIWNKNNEN